MFGGSVNKIPQTVRRHAQLALQCFTSLSCIFIFSDLCFITSLRSTENFYWCSYWSRSLLLTCATSAEAWLSRLGHSTTADSILFAILTLLNWTAGIIMKCLQMDQAAAVDSCELNYSFPDNKDWICSKEEFQTGPLPHYPNNFYFLLPLVGQKGG